MTQRPIDRSVFLGHSAEGSLDAAIADAIRAASSEDAGPQVDFVINRIFGQFGGSHGRRDLYAEIRLDRDIAQELPEQTAPPKHAARLQLVEHSIQGLELVGLPTSPPQFVLRGTREMPTPGWTFHIDEVRVDSQLSRVSVKLTEVPPADGAATSATDPAPLSIQLGTLRAGRYVVELSARRSPSEGYRLLQAVVIEAL